MGMMSELMIQHHEEMIAGQPLCHCPRHNCVTMTNQDVCAVCAASMCTTTYTLDELEGMEYDDYAEALRDHQDAMAEAAYEDNAGWQY
tara:strand:+ start:400 stop:663 length:264 start_codon:yes stop_codon:yes gene_type:complete